MPEHVAWCLPLRQPSMANATRWPSSTIIARRTVHKVLVFHDVTASSTRWHLRVRLQIRHADCFPMTGHALSSLSYSRCSGTPGKPSKGLVRKSCKPRTARKLCGHARCFDTFPSNRRGPFMSSTLNPPSSSNQSGTSPSKGPSKSANSVRQAAISGVANYVPQSLGVRLRQHGSSRLLLDQCIRQVGHEGSAPQVDLQSPDADHRVG